MCNELILANYICNYKIAPNEQYPTVRTDKMLPMMENPWLEGLHVSKSYYGTVECIKVLNIVKSTI